ncbi:MAG TPA: cobalt ECF transporter T component CbiQ [Spirochaetota bacterium]|nr:cobalt ECF transporter T component CbiQ [Spirochaetota bacterium]
MNVISSLETALLNLGRMDILACQDTALHRVDPRSKIITTIVFLAAVVSFGKYEISQMVPFVIYPVYLLSAGNIPAGYILKKVLYVSPFALMIGIFNPLLDHRIVMMLGSHAVSGGWISLCSIMLRFFLTVTTALALIACTGFNNVCYALHKLGAPRIFVVQLLFLYRYLFVLMEEGARMMRARNLRSFDGRGSSLRVYGSLVGHLLLRTVNRAQRIHNAMVCRGFDGNIRIMRKSSLNLKDFIFILAWCGVFVLFRFVNVAQLAGIIITGLF